MKKRFYCILLCLVLCITGCGGKTSTEDSSEKLPEGPKPGLPEQAEITEEGMTGKIYDKGVFLMTKNNVKRIGRTMLANDVLWFSFSASGVEFEFTGKKCTFDLKSDSIFAETNHQARYAVYVDDEIVVTDVLDKPLKSVEAFASDKAETHIIRLLKLSETSDSTMGITHITCDEEAVIKPTADKKLKIEFVGDSITCGYGVEGTLKDTYSTHNENATKAYAYKTAKKLDADYSLVSLSGYGIISGYTSGDKVEVQQLPKYYDKFGNSYGSFNLGKKPRETDWDFSKFTPDIVVINLGTNDNSYTKNDSAKCEEYVQGYVSFLKTVREKNPDATILCVLGVMGQELYPSIEETVRRYTEETKDDKVYSFKLDVQDAGKNGFAVDYHPTEASHEHASDQMVEVINSILAGTFNK